MATAVQERTYHQIRPMCRECEQEVRLERLGVTSEGQVEVLGACPSGHIVRLALHFAELIAKAAVQERTHRGDLNLTPFAEVVRA